MAELIYTAIASLDGYVSDEDGKWDWSVPDPEVHAFVNDLERPVGTHLYGRRMYEVLVAWETMDDPDPLMRDYAEIWRAAEKIVYSSTLEQVSSARTRIEPRFDPDAVRELKSAAGRDLAIGGPTLAAAATRSTCSCHPSPSGAATRRSRAAPGSTSSWWTSAASATAPSTSPFGFSRRC